MTTYRLPTDKCTRSSSRYVKAWRKLAKPISAKLSVRLYAFDPNLVFVRSNGSTFDVEIDLALEFYKLCTKEDFCC